MNDQDKPKFSEIMTRIGEVYGKSITPSYLELFWRLLSGFEMLAVEAAVEAHMLDPDIGQYPPKPADLVRWIEGDSETRACEAWSALLSAVRTVGRYEKPHFADPTIKRVIERLGGWGALCQSSQFELTRREREFYKLYKACVRYQAKQARLEILLPTCPIVRSQDHKTLPLMSQPSGITAMEERQWSALTLTEMEIEVLRKASFDLPIKAMAKSLELSPETVKWHRKNILVKMRCRTITKAVIEAYKAGIL